MEALQIWVRNLETKQEIRKQIRKIRDQIEPDVWQRATGVITEQVIQSDNFREATDLLCYLNIQSETGTHAIIEEAWRLGKNVWVPKVSGNEMNFFCIHSFAELKKGSYDVPEPDGNGTPFDASCALMTLMILPGVAFDKRGNRIGYGKGYYDRYLNSNSGIETVGICFDLQVIDKIPAEDTDHSLDMLCTETLCLHFTEL